MKVVSVVGNRPQFIKAAPLARALAPVCDHVLVHTGQHYDEELSAVFFDELGLRPPDHRIETGSGSHAQQTGSMLVGLEPVLASEQPDVVLVYGDTNSTLAGALVAVKSGYRIGHVESGLRSFDRAMPEEVNRVVTDVISDLRFCPSQVAVDNLAAEGITQGVHLVGDVMVDVAVQFGALARRRSTILERLSIEPQGYALITVHRQSNTEAAALGALVEMLESIEGPLVFPLHPRTESALSRRGLLERAERAALVTPAARLPRLHGPAGLGPRLPDRLRGRAEGGLPAVRAMPDAARHQRVGGDDRAGLEPVGRDGSRGRGEGARGDTDPGRAPAALRRRARRRPDRRAGCRPGPLTVGTIWR